MEREAVRVIVTRGDELLVMRRNKYGEKYYTLIGGHIEPNEEPVEAMLREVAEETSLHITNPKLVYMQSPKGPYNWQHIFTAEYVNGEIAMRPDADEQTANKAGQNTYEPLWIPLTDLAELPLFPIELKDQLVHDLQSGFSDEPITINPKGD